MNLSVPFCIHISFPLSTWLPGGIIGLKSNGKNRTWTVCILSEWAQGLIWKSHQADQTGSWKLFFIYKRVIPFHSNVRRCCVNTTDFLNVKLRCCNRVFMAWWISNFSCSSLQDLQNLLMLLGIKIMLRSYRSIS